MCNNVKKRKHFTFTDYFFDMHTASFVDGTKSLILRGGEMEEKIGRRISNGDLLIIINYLRKNDAIVALELPYNELNDCGIYSLSSFIRERPNMKYLNVIGNNVAEKGMGYFAALDCFPLITLRLTGNKIGNKGAEQLYQILTSINALKYLDISDINQSLAGVAYIIAALMPNRGGTSCLEYLDIGRPLPKTYHQIDDAHVAELLSQLFAVNKHLKELHIQQYGFDFRDMEIMLDGLLLNSTLICLDLNNNNIGDDGIDFLCKYLRTSPPLECLMIGANNFSNLGATSLSMNLPFSKIKLLDITNNRITDEGMISIFHTIKKEVKLKALFLWGNKLTHESLLVLKRLFLRKLLQENDVDVKLYCQDRKLYAAWNPQANRYTHRFYCVSDYGFSQLMKPVKVPPQPAELPDIYYRFHVDQEKMGLPAADWLTQWPVAKFVDPD